MVGATGIEPVTPAMSRQCSTAELRAHRRKAVVYIAALGLASAIGKMTCRRDAPAPRAMRLGWSLSPVAPAHDALDCRLPQRQTAAAGRCLSAQRIGLSRRFPGPGRRVAGGPAPCRRCLRRRAVRRRPGARHAPAGRALSALLRRRQPRALRARSRHVRRAPAAAAQSPHHPRRRRPRHDPARGGQRRGDLSRPRAVRRDRAAGWKPAGGPIIDAVDAGRANPPAVRQRPADRRPFHAVLGVGHGPARPRSPRRYRAGRQSWRILRPRCWSTAPSAGSPATG